MLGRYTALVAGLVLVIAACSADDAATTTTEAGATTTTEAGATTTTEAGATTTTVVVDTPGDRTLVVAESVDLITFDPMNSTLLTTFRQWTWFYEGLFEVRSDGVLEPKLATSWEISDDRLTYTFNLREGVKFHNGETFTAQDVVFSFGRVDDSPIPFIQSGLEAIDSVTAVDDLTVEFHLSQPDSGLFFTLGNPFPFGTAILNETAATAADPATVVVGSGPYKVVSFAPGNEMVLERFDDYWGDLPDLAPDRVIVRVIPDESSQVAALIAGQVDVIFPSADSLATLEQEDSIDVIELVGTGIINLNINSAEAPLDDVNVRRAIALAIDREELVEGALNGHGAPGAWFPPGLEWAPPAEEFAYHTFDPEESRRLLEAAGYGDGLTIRFNSIGPSFAEYIPRHAELLQAQFARVGIELIIEPADRTTWVQKLVNREYEMGDNFTPFWANPVIYIIPREGRQGPTPQAMADAFAEAKRDDPEKLIDNMIAIAHMEAELVFPELRTIGVNEFVAYRSDRMSNVNPDSTMRRTFLHFVDYSG